MNLLDFAIKDIEIIETEEETISTTYKLDIERAIIQGKITDLESLRQAIYKELKTEKYEYPIYSYDYGTELHTLIGMDSHAYVEVEAKRMITECLEKYSEIESVGDFEFTFSGDEVLITFTVTSIYGTTIEKLEVG